MAKRPDAAPLLSAEWINGVMDTVYDRAMEIYEAIFRDLLWSGYLPMERPASSDFIKRLTPEQRQTLGLEEPAPEGLAFEGQAAILPPEAPSGPLAPM